MRFILWREKHISERVFVLILAFIVGLATAVAAFVLKELVHTLRQRSVISISIWCSRRWVFLPRP